MNPAKNININNPSKIDQEVNKLSKLLSNSLIIKYIIEKKSKININNIEFNICISGFKYRRRNNHDENETLKKKTPKKKTPKINSPRRIGLIAYRRKKYENSSLIRYKHHIKRYISKGFVTNIFYDPSINTEPDDLEIYKKITDYIIMKSDGLNNDSKDSNNNNERSSQETNYYWNDSINEVINDDKKTTKRKKSKKYVNVKEVEEEEVEEEVKKEVEEVEEEVEEEVNRSSKSNKIPAPWSKKSNKYKQYVINHPGYENKTDYNKNKWINMTNDNNDKKK